MAENKNKKSEKTDYYLPFNKVLIRTPFLPFETLDNINLEKLKEIAQRDVFQEAIFLASPVLYEELQKWLNGELVIPKEVEKLQFSLMRYLIRMSCRCTPFGLFAGCTVREKSENITSEKTEIILSSQKEYYRHTRLDMNYLCALAQDLSKNIVIKENIKYYPNSSIYTIGNQLRYVEYRYQNTNRTHHIVAVENTGFLQTILNAATNGIYLNDLVKLLVSSDINTDEAKEFLNELIGYQLLVNELEPAITGNEFLEQILKVLEPIKETEQIKENLFKVKTELFQIDKSPIGLPVESYKQIATKLETLGTKYEAKFLFQSDMVKPALNSEINKKIADDVLSGIEVLNKFTPKYFENNINKFRDTFYERYEEREITLCEALDLESGIGYNKGSQDAGDITPLVDDIILGGKQGANSYDLKWNGMQSFLFNKYLKAVKENKTSVELTDEDLKQFNANWSDLPYTLSAMVKVLGDKILINSAGGSSAANLLGRFCHSDEAIYEMTKEITQKEEDLNPDVIFAEIVHLPESRTGNILLRPVLRKYEIPYLAKSAVPEEFQLKLEDLFLSVKKGRIVLRSKNLNKEIIPRLSSAHNYSFNALPIYQFLCDLQTQNIRGGVSFSWGALSNEYSFLPRVTYKNLIFSLATWKIKKEDIKHLFEIKEDNKLIEAVTEWRQKDKIPAYIVISEGDNELFINLENSLMIRTMLSIVKNKGMFQIEEFLFDSENAVVKSEEGSFTNEMIITFYKNKNNDI